jgi:hypothetical protein
VRRVHFWARNCETRLALCNTGEIVLAEEHPRATLGASVDRVLTVKAIFIALFTDEIIVCIKRVNVARFELKL